MDALLNIIRREALRVLGTRGTARIGIVDSYDPDNHAAKVLFQPEGVLSGWLPVGTAFSGNGYGLHFAPSPGDQVEVRTLEGSKQGGIIGMRLYSDADRPLSVPAGEMWAIHKTGSGWKFHNDGTGEIITSGNLTVTVGGDLIGNVTGNCAMTIGGDASADVSGNLTTTVSGDLSTDVDGDATINVSGAMNLGGTGGMQVARVGDSVNLSTGIIQTGSSKVSAA